MLNQLWSLMNDGLVLVLGINCFLFRLHYRIIIIRLNDLRFSWLDLNIGQLKGFQAFSLFKVS